jgi:hypothetical protein
MWLPWTACQGIYPVIGHKAVIGSYRSAKSDSLKVPIARATGALRKAIALGGNR